MARAPGWLFALVFVLLPALLVALDLLVLVPAEVWVVPWLTLLSLMWTTFGLLVAVALVPGNEEAV